MQWAGLAILIICLSIYFKTFASHVFFSRLFSLFFPSDPMIDWEWLWIKSEDKRKSFSLKLTNQM